MEKKLTLHQRIAAVLLILLVYLCGRWCLQDCFGLNTCGYSDASMIRYLEDQSIGGWGYYKVLKTARNSWNSDLSSRCAAAVYGDNRTGTVEGYASGDAPEVHRANLEADYILDLYTLDGIEALPQALQTY